MRVFVVTAGRVQHPIRRGEMLDRGYKLYLDPEQYPKHAELLAIMKRKGFDPVARTGGGWTELKIEQEPSAPPPPEVGASWDDGERAVGSSVPVLPHQREVINQLQRDALVT